MRKANKKSQEKEARRAWKKTAVVVGFVCVGVVAVVIAMNPDGLPVHSNASEPTG